MVIVFVVQHHWPIQLSSKTGHNLHSVFTENIKMLDEIELPEADGREPRFFFHLTHGGLSG